MSLRIGAVGALMHLEPTMVSSESALIKSLVFEQFLLPAPDGGWRSRVVKEWERAGPGRYRLRLDPAVRFSDGSEVKAAEVVASLASVSVRATERDGWFELESLTKAPLDAALLVATLSKQTPTGPLGTGPFKVQSQTPERVHLRRLVPRAGRINDVELLSFPSPNDAFAATVRGELNALLTPDSGQLELLEDMPHLRVVRGRGIHSVVVIFNVQAVPLEQRRTIAAALSPSELTRAHGGNCEEEPGAPSSRSLLPVGAPLDVLTYEDPAMARTALAVRRALGPRGGEVDVVPIPELVGRISQGRYQLVVMTLLTWPPHALGSVWHSQGRGNSSRYSNPALDQALSAGELAKAEALLEQDAPFVKLCRRQRAVVLDARLRTATLGTYDALETLPDWEVHP